MEALIDLIANVGIPAGIALWLLYEHREIRHQRREERDDWREGLDEQTQEIRELRKDLTRQHTPQARPVADGGDERDVEDDRE